MSLNQDITAFASRTALTLAMLDDRALRAETRARLTVAIQDYGGVADGDGEGNGTDNTAAIQAAIDDLAARGGGDIYFPAQSGWYVWSREVAARSNITLRLDRQAKIDHSNRLGVLVRGQGSIGPEIDLAVAAVQRNRTLTTAAAHGMDVGDWFLLKGVLNVLSFADCGELVLGRATSNQKLYPGEFHQVFASDDATNIQMEAGVILPHGYGLSQVGTGDRACSTVQKIEFIENFWITGGTWSRRRSDTSTTQGTTVCRFEWARSCGVIGGSDFDSSTFAGSSVYFINCMNCHGDATVRHDPSHIFDAHQHGNSVRVVGSQFCTFNLNDIDGAQGIDETYEDGGHTSVANVFSGRAIRNKEDGITSHGGSYGSGVDGFYGYNCWRAPVNWRASFGFLRNITGVCPTVEAENGIRLGSGVRELTMSNIYIDGAADGLYVHSELTGWAMRRNIRLSDFYFTNCARAINLQDSTNAMSLTSGIAFSNGSIEGSGEYALRVGAYINGVSVDPSVKIGPMTRTFGGQKRAIILAQNSVQNVIEATIDDIGASADAVQAQTVSDTTTFPPALFPGGDPQNRLNCRVIGRQRRLYDVPNVREARPVVTSPQRIWGGSTIESGTYYNGFTPGGLADGKRGSFFAIWRFSGSASGSQRLVTNNTERFLIFRNSSGGITVVGQNSSETEILRVATVENICATSGTYAIWISYDLAVPGSARIRVKDLNRLTETTGAVTVTTFTDQEIDYTTAAWSIGASTSGGHPATGDAYVVWMDTVNYYDFAAATMRARFIDPNGVPIWLGADGSIPGGEQPIIFLAYDDYDDWRTNKGSAAGSFTANGAPGSPAVTLRGQYFA